jgi:RHS repeat-associated protein
LAGSTIGTYTYNALGQRIQKLVGGVSDRFDYNEQGQIIGDYGSTSRDYVWVDGLPVANVDSTGVTATITYVTADQLNTPRVITNAGGSAIWQWSYQGNPWGEVAPTAAGYTYNLQYPGQYFDAESGLNNNYFRDYDPTVGRYAQSDPSGLSGGMNTYAYVGNSPLSATDPRGLDDTICMFNPSFCGMSTAPSNPNLSAQNNPDLQGNLATGAEVGLATGAVAGGLVVANVIGFPEVEIGEAAAVAIGGEGVLSLEIMDALAGEPIGSIAVGAISGTGAGAIMGGAGGYMATRATAPPTPPTSSTSAQHGPYDTGDCP